MIPRLGTFSSDAVAIWNAGVDAIRAEPLVKREVVVDDQWLTINDRSWHRDEVDRLVVVGAGKAATAMAAGLISSVGSWCEISGWINVPGGTQRDLSGIRVHVARPPGVNEPTTCGIEGSRAMIQLLRSAGPRDLCIALISGGGSALLPLPRKGITLDDKVTVTRYLSHQGASIVELNTVRKHLSDIKGGGLLAACRGLELVTLVLSDVLGDPLDLIASGPTVTDPSTPQDALAVLGKFDPNRTLPANIYNVLDSRPLSKPQVTCRSSIFVIGNNAVAVDAAGICAESLGYNHVMSSARQCEGAAEEVGRHLAEMTMQMLAGGANNCLITGGEPTVSLVASDRRGRGGRNQQLVLAAYAHLLHTGDESLPWERFALLSGGTDGEDGPTDAAGALLNESVHRAARSLELEPSEYLARNDAYTFFERTGGLLKTGPTGTNVCDLRVVTLHPSATVNRFPGG